MRDDPVTGRLAPSPTGALHLGHAFSFLAASWSAQSRGGRVVLRLEDVDSDRAGEEHIRACLEDLTWLGLAWDGEPILQSSRTSHLLNAADVLSDRGLAYPCVCTRKDLLRAGSGEESLGAPHEGGPRYPGTCRGKYVSLAEAEASAQKEAGLRLFAQNESISFRDAVFGDYSENLAETVGDFLILRRNKVPAYQLAVVVDDQQDGVTEVVRGRDLLSSTARQIVVARALGLSHPRYAHIPLICDSNGKRLAKRDNSRSLAQLRAEGISPERIRAWAWRTLGQSQDSRHIEPSCFRWESAPREDIALPLELNAAL